MLVLAVLLLALPLLLGALALGTGGLPHEGLAAASARDVSAAALDRIERFLHGDLTVALVAPASGFELACDARAGHDAGCAAPDAPAAFPAAATAERRL